MAKGIKVKFSSALKAQTHEAETIVTEEGSVKKILDALVNKYGEAFQKRVFDETGSLRKFINIYVNGEDIRFSKGIETKLKSGDELLLLPAVSGG